MRRAERHALLGASRRAIRSACSRQAAGFALLEVIIAVVIFATAGAALTALASESATAIGRTRAVEVEQHAASAFMHAVALWPREDLERHLGERTQGAWRMRVERPTSTVFVITLADSAGRVVLWTALYREEDSDATR